MSRKIFLSFLGTNNYLECNYFIEGHPDQKVEKVKYIQEALVKLYCQNFTENDEVLLFLTEKAEQMNFLNDGQYNRDSDKLDFPNVGLKSKLEDLQSNGLAFSLNHIRIKEGFSQEEIWSIFETIADQIQDDDEITFDITHAFRFLPMLGVVLLNYLKTTKNIIVKGIHYGAFEKLGNHSEVSKLAISDRNAPIINLNTLLEFQTWTSAVNSFIKFGETKELSKASHPKIQSRMTESRGSDLATKDLRYVIDQLSELTSNLQTNRLNSLFGNDFTLFKEKLTSVQETDMAVKPFKQILKLIEKKVTPIVTSNDLIWLESAKWCLEHKLVQQAFTQLQEGMLTYCINQIKIELIQNPQIEKLFTENGISKSISFIEKEDRQFYGGLLNIIYKKSQNKLKETNSNAINTLADFLLNTRFEKLGTIYAYITEPRNDINHAGLRNDPMKSEALQRRIGELIIEVENILKA